MDPYKQKATKGEISLFEVYSEVVESLKDEISPESILSKHLNLYRESSLENDQDVMDLIEKLKENYKVICLTNTEKEVADYNWGRGLFNDFDSAFISVEMGMMKPDREIYEKVLENLEISADDALFIDDKQEYVDGAEEVGIKSIKFENYSQLKRELELIGILQGIQIIGRCAGKLRYSMTFLIIAIIVFVIKESLKVINFIQITNLELIKNIANIIIITLLLLSIYSMRLIITQIDKNNKKGSGDQGFLDSCFGFESLLNGC